MNRRAGALVVLLVATACLDAGAPGGGQVRLAISPVFQSHGELASEADRLRIRLFRVNPGPPRDSLLVKDTTVSVNADGTAEANIGVSLLESPQFFRVVLDAVRSADGTLLFSGSGVVVVTSGASSAAPQEISVPLAYTGPVGARIVIAPKDTTIAAGGSFTLRAIVFDAGDLPISSSPRFYLVNPADATRLAVNRLTGLVTGQPGATGAVLVYVETPDLVPPRDTARIFLGLVPALVKVTPGIGNVAVGNTLSFTGTVFDAFNNTVPGSSVTWVSRSPAVATVNGSGLVTGAGVGVSVVVATAGALGDSVQVTVPTAGHAVFSTAARGRSFGSLAVNDTITVDVTADMRFTPGEKLGSYNAKLSWNTSQLQLEAVSAGDTGFNPTVNTASCIGAQLCFADANANGAAGTPVVARVRFKALATGAAGLTLTFTEVSASSPTFTNLFATSRVTVTNAKVTVR